MVDYPFPLQPRLKNRVDGSFGGRDPAGANSLVTKSDGVRLYFLYLHSPATAR